MKNFIDKIKNLTLEKINKNLIIIAILSLLFRVGNFATTHIPKPFELIILMIVVLTIIDAIKNKKIKEFFYSVPQNIRIALYCIVISILFGWVIGTLLGTSINFNMILEIGSFIFSLTLFLLIFFYSRNDKQFIIKCLYALLTQVVYVLFIIFPEIVGKLNMLEVNAKFIGFTTNPNIISKILLIPIVYFITMTIFEAKNIWLKVSYFFISSMLVSLLLWTASRGAILCLSIGVIYIIYIYSNRFSNWKNIIKGLTIGLLIMLLGFVFTPSSGKKMVLNRSLNTVDNQLPYDKIENKKINEIIRNSLRDTQVTGEKWFNSSNNIKNNNNIFKIVYIKITSELRLKIWSFYLKKTIINPLGYGPDTHMPSYIMRSDGQYDNTGPHNSYIQIWLWGGLIGLFGFIYLIYVAFKNLRKQKTQEYNSLLASLCGILVSLIVSLFFDDNFTFVFFWIILAIAIIYDNKHNS